MSSALGRPIEWEAVERIPDRKQQKIINAFIASGFDFSRIEEFAIELGYSAKTAKFAGLRAIKFLGANPLMQIALEKKGIDFERLAKKVDELLEVRSPKNENVPDGFVQAKVVEMAFRLLGANPPSQIKIDKHETREYIYPDSLEKRIKKAKKVEIIDIESTEEDPRI
jgi:hypothetical protein